MLRRTDRSLKGMKQEFASRSYQGNQAKITLLGIWFRSCVCVINACFVRKQNLYLDLIFGTFRPANIIMRCLCGTRAPPDSLSCFNLNSNYVCYEVFWNSRRVWLETSQCRYDIIISELKHRNFDFKLLGRLCLVWREWWCIFVAILSDLLVDKIFISSHWIIIDSFRFFSFSVKKYIMCLKTLNDSK